MKCIKCGKEIGQDTFCAYCGTDNSINDSSDILARLITDAGNGDKQAVNDLIASVYPLMLRQARIICGNDADAQDVVQESSVKIVKSLNTLSNPRAFNGWVNRTVRNTALDFFRKAPNKHDVFFTDLENTDGGLVYDPEDERITSRPDLQMSDLARKEIITEVLDSLKEDQRIIAVMYFFDGLSMKEIAQELNIKESTVVGRINTAKKHIRSSVETIQKRDDIKLYNLSPVAWFIWLLRGWKESGEESGAQMLQDAAQRYTQQAASAQSTADAAGSRITADTAQTVTTASAAAVTAASAAGLSTAAKAGIAAAVIAIGGAAVFGVSRMMKKPEPEPEPVIEPAPEETPDPVTAVWVHEPDLQFDHVYEIKTMENCIEFNGEEKHRIPFIYEQSGYPQTWDDSNSGYTPDSITVEHGGRFGIYDYSGNVLFDTVIQTFGTPNPRTDVFTELNDPAGPVRYYPVDHVLYYLTAPYNYMTYPAPARAFNKDFQGDYELNWGGYSGMFFGAYTCGGRIVQLDYGGYADYYPSKPQFLMNVTDFGYIGSGDEYNHITGFSCVDANGIRYEVSGYPYNFVNGFFAMDSSLEHTNGIHVFSGHNQIMNAGTGQPINDQVYEAVKFFEDGYCPVKKNGKWGFINEQGEEVTDFIWDDVSTLYEGKAYVGINGVYGVIDLPASLNNGKVTLETVYGDALPVAPAAEPQPASSGKLGTVTIISDTPINIRTGAGTSYDKVSQTSRGSSYDVYETAQADGYTWYRIGENLWIADNGSWAEYTQG